MSGINSPYQARRPELELVDKLELASDILEMVQDPETVTYLQNCYPGFLDDFLRDCQDLREAGVSVIRELGYEWSRD